MHVYLLNSKICPCIQDWRSELSGRMIIIRWCFFSECGPEVTVSPHARASICCGWISGNDRQGYGCRFSSCFYGAFTAALLGEGIKFLNMSSSIQRWFDGGECRVCSAAVVSFFSFLLWSSKLNMNPCDVVQNEAKKCIIFLFCI